ncbi:MAG: hypothetical protein ACXVZV_05590, partial [Terriglobales bacterium]
YGAATRGARVAFFGFDALARRAALELERTGTQIIAVADRSGGVYDAAGLNVMSLIKHVECEEVVFGYSEAAGIPVHDLLNESCDALILCGPERLVHSTSARVVFEAGGEFKGQLPARTPLIPSLLADFGLSFAAFCEWRKNSSGGFSDLDGLRGLPVHVRNTWREVYEYSQRHELSLRAASLAVALSRVAEAMRMK